MQCHVFMLSGFLKCTDSANALTPIIQT